MIVTIYSLNYLENVLYSCILVVDIPIDEEGSMIFKTYLSNVI